MAEVDRSLRWRAKRELGLASVADAHTGGVVAVQRADSALRLNVHFHTLELDGVYVHENDDPGAPLEFRELDTPTQADIAEVAARTAVRIDKISKAHGRSLDPELGDDTPPELALDEPGLAACYAAAAQGLSVASAARGRAGGSGKAMSRSGAFPACSAGVMVNKRPQVRVSLTVEPSGAPTFVSQWTWVFSVSDTQTYKVGAKVKVYFDPADRGHVAVVSLAQ